MGDLSNVTISVQFEMASYLKIHFMVGVLCAKFHTFFKKCTAIFCQELITVELLLTLDFAMPLY